MKPTQQLWRSRRGNALVTVLIFCMALLIMSTAFFRSMSSNRRISHRSELLMQSREGAEAALSFAMSELNKRATSLASVSDNPLSGFTLTTEEKDYLSSSSTHNNLVASSIEVKPGKISAAKTDMTLYDNDPGYTGDPSAGLTLSVRSGLVYAKASSLDPVSGSVHNSYVSGVVQVREQTWLNYGMFYNMDMEFYPGKPMDVKGAVHTNADMYLGSAGSVVNFYRKVTAAGHIYRGFKYCSKAFNADGTLTGFEDKGGFNISNGEGTGKVYISKDGSTLVEMTGSMDCLGAKTKPADNTTAWVTLEKSTWNKYVMDVSLSIEKFTPPGLPLFVPENLKTPATELRNHAYAMIEPQLPATDNKRYYGRKNDAAENLKFSALAGLTIVVEDLDLSADSSAGDLYVAGATNVLKASEKGYAIPWKLVWYEGDTLATQPITKENLPKRDGTSKLPVAHVIDPFARNDEVDKGYDGSVAVTMRRNLKALLRDAIVVVPYHDSGGSSSVFGTGTSAVNITTYPTTAVGTSFIPDVSYTRYNQPAGAWPILNTTDATYNAIYYGQATNSFTPTPTGTVLIRYPDYTAPTNAASAGKLNDVTGAYSGHYDRRQGFKKSTTANDGLKGAQHIVYINLQKLNWILNNSELWKNPATGLPIYKFDESYTNLIYVDLPSKAKDTTRFALTDSDKICPALSPTSTKPGYALILDKGSRLPRLTYNEFLRTPGFTLATNGPLYIKGNFNADGVSSTGDSILPDSSSWYSATYPNANEVPAMVAADAITFLTEGYSLKASNKGLSGDATKPTVGINGGGKQLDGFAGTTTTTSSSFQEISTAIICGLVATVPYYYTQSPYTNDTLIHSGSVNNLPRFLENNTNVTVRYRGSMAALFESEVSNAPFFEGPHSFWFSPPTRDWGYHQYLAAGKYPPGTPVLRTTRLIGVRDITAAEYAAGPAQLP